jgi:hypothetical protein
MGSGGVREILEDFVAIGPRLTGSHGEAAAARYAAAHFREAGFEVGIEPFEASRWPYRLATPVVPAAAAITTLAASSSMGTYPLGALVLLTALLVVAAASASWHRMLPDLFDLGDRVRSANVVARSAGWGEGRPVLVLTAHLDTKTQLLPTAAQLLALFSALVSLVGLWVFALIDSMSAGRVPNGALVVLTAIAVTGLVTVAANVGSPRLSRGVLDNGSGVALILHLASLLPARVGNRLNLLLVATGAEEIGLAGALRFAQRHRGSLDPGRTLCLNFDVLGHGGRVFLTGSRAPFAGVRDRLVARLIGRGFAVGSLPFLLGAGMDHQRLSAAGLWAISLTEGPGQVLWHVHGRDDRHDLVDPERLARIAEALLETVEDIASDAFVPGKSR